ncbi:MAG: type III-B CRISPR module RAMP protein Cmr1 [Stellaceae bacterium]
MIKEVGEAYPEKPPGRAVPPVPEMPAPIRRLQRGEPARASFSVEIETVTPILGGAPEPRTIDQVDVIRVPTIRGHLRFWWRALQRDPELLADPAKLAAAEAALWGKAADNAGGRSPVEIRVEILHSSQIDRDNVDANSVAGYALWPARQGEQDPAPAPRRRPGVRFHLHVTASASVLCDVRNAVRAWVLFGGYGSRTRRGVGSLTVAGEEEEQAEWLPHLDNPGTLIGRSQLRSGLSVAFGTDVLAPLTTPREPSFPILAGAFLVIGGFKESATDVWTQALQWLRDFRQREDFARNPGTAPLRPGRSRWPEPDKLRRLFGTHSAAHAPRYDASPAWPRAQFGLPILGQFSNARGPGEPPKFELTWQDARGKLQDRMASPLIIKPLPVVGGFYPCALWLMRGYPPGEVVVLRQGGRAQGAVTGSEAVFRPALSDADKTVAEKLKAPWGGTPDLRNPFLSAVLNGVLDPEGRRGTRVAP